MERIACFCSELQNDSEFSHTDRNPSSNDLILTFYRSRTVTDTTATEQPPALTELSVPVYGDG